MYFRIKTLVSPPSIRQHYSIDLTVCICMHIYGMFTCIGRDKTINYLILHKCVTPAILISTCGFYTERINFTITF